MDFAASGRVRRWSVKHGSYTDKHASGVAMQTRVIDQLQMQYQSAVLTLRTYDTTAL
jgi:hypothetical protein